ncbi:MAG: hypothetical protein IT562_25230 [Alphaproteobacteria bacterium]|nr:hypothetical protein [Alphaproteobacteria bacterium]
MRPDLRLAAGAGLILLAALPPLAPLLESRLPVHVLGQYTTIVAGGAWIGAALARNREVRWSAAPALLAAVLTLGFWLLPRWIDASVASAAVDIAKVACLALLAGVPLGWGWAMAGPVLRGFFVANAGAMLAVMGWLLLVVPDRLCNAYLITDQRMLGNGLLIAAAILVLGLLLRAFGGGRPAEERRGGAAAEGRPLMQVGRPPDRSRRPGRPRPA